MRLLHTSDWHVGRTFHGRPLLADQASVLGGLADTVRTHGVDAVLISGDLYDRAIPSPEAVQTVTRALEDIRAAGAVIVATSGNHDSATRLGAFGGFLAAGGLHLRTSPTRVAEPVLLHDADGPVACYPVPYLEPEIARSAWGLDGPASHQAVLARATDDIRADLAARPAGTRSVVMAHAFVTGGSAAGSERSIAVGGVESVSADVFEGFDYVALGHLHGRQTVRERIRYSGSPLPYSFSERSHRKSAWLVDLDADGAMRAEAIDLPVARPLASVRGRLDDILVAHADLADHYLEVELTDPVRPVDPMRQLQRRFPYAVKLSWQPEQDDPRSLRDRAPASGAMSADDELIDDFLSECRGSRASRHERFLIDGALAGHRQAEAAG
ncbi:exonuclease SbcCD subunit D [Nakamurella leprariae]|uniref:Nuclease SbcCD subunit D n=1 Tax=Nakamurella leprariae TaxID=2803911 RepID=A0A938YHD9_9ACTN|nr:exonuclease SbcCD subunit D [Nakamurella leprariae]MBM9469536.1 exonuclease SbcCD subunit D [Nakamurella leprariae]